MPHLDESQAALARTAQQARLRRPQGIIYTASTSPPEARPAVDDDFRTRHRPPGYPPEPPSAVAVQDAASTVRENVKESTSRSRRLTRLTS
ncbi:hypothetical protein CDD80_1763 [Ophiocordyceps camponoti-rufipedis]|uniref:Uncharacterized protein n=1 Tax=Ophiocordyceps camponoti-rufipedis TaxID=2004952 RepID=A0A2C5XY23_9HYPO|nr:hypothetical protein CDD80_1763 [Ophiocordyceps camponoti-rufipedis]